MLSIYFRCFGADLRVVNGVSTGSLLLCTGQLTGSAGQLTGSAAQSANRQLLLVPRVLTGSYS